MKATIQLAGIQMTSDRIITVPTMFALMNITANIQHKIIQQQHSLMAIFQANPGKPVPECLHSGFYWSKDYGGVWSLQEVSDHILGFWSCAVGLPGTWQHYHRSLFHRSNGKSLHCTERGETRKAEAQGVVSTLLHASSQALAAIRNFADDFRCWNDLWR